MKEPDARQYFLLIDRFCLSDCDIRLRDNVLWYGWYVACLLGCVDSFDSSSDQLCVENVYFCYQISFSAG